MGIPRRFKSAGIALRRTWAGVSSCSGTARSTTRCGRTSRFGSIWSVTRRSVACRPGRYRGWSICIFRGCRLRSTRRSRRSIARAGRAGSCRSQWPWWAGPRWCCWTSRAPGWIRGVSGSCGTRYSRVSR